MVVCTAHTLLTGFCPPGTWKGVSPFLWVRAAPRQYVHLAVGVHVGPSEVRWEPRVLSCPLAPCSDTSCAPLLFSWGRGCHLPSCHWLSCWRCPKVTAGLHQLVPAGAWLTFYKQVVRMILQPPWILFYFFLNRQLLSSSESFLALF